jgi:hypothetical protein
MTTCILNVVPLIKYRKGNSLVFLSNPNEAIQKHLDSIMESNTGSIIDKGICNMPAAVYVGYVWLGDHIALYWRINDEITKYRVDEIIDRISGILIMINHKIEYPELNTELRKLSIDHAGICLACTSVDVMYSHPTDVMSPRS